MSYRNPCRRHYSLNNYLFVSNVKYIRPTNGNKKRASRLNPLSKKRASHLNSLSKRINIVLNQLALIPIPLMETSHLTGVRNHVITPVLNTDQG